VVEGEREGILYEGRGEEVGDVQCDADAATVGVRLARSVGDAVAAGEREGTSREGRGEKEPDALWQAVAGGEAVADGEREGMLSVGRGEDEARALCVAETAVVAEKALALEEGQAKGDAVAAPAAVQRSKHKTK
jgi:hypothetical protein